MKRNISVRYLLDVNIPHGIGISNLCVERVGSFLVLQEPNRLWASCPLTRAGFLRIATRTLKSSARILACRCRSARFRRFAANLPDRAEPGRRHATLLTLAQRRKGRVATLDTGLGELAKATGYSSSVLVLQS